MDWSVQQGAQLRDMRETSGLTQRQVSVALDLAQAAISGWERGEARPRRHNPVSHQGRITSTSRVVKPPPTPLAVAPASS